MSIENIKMESTLNNKGEELSKKIDSLKEELNKKQPDIILTTGFESSSDKVENPVADEELFKWGKEQVGKMQNELENLSKEEQKIQLQKRTRELRDLIRSYEEAIKAIERGEKYQVILNKTNFDAKYDSVDKLHEQITQAESELRELEKQSLMNSIIQKDTISKKDTISDLQNTTDEKIDIEKQDVQINPEISPVDSSDQELKQVLIEIEEAQDQLQKALIQESEVKKTQSIFSKLKGMFGGKKQTLSEVGVAQRVLDDARMRYEQILKSKK